MILEADKDAVNKYIHEGVFGLDLQDPHDYVDNVFASGRLREQLGIFGYHDLPDGSHDLAEAAVVIIDEVCNAWDIDMFLVLDDTTGDEVCRICRRITDYDHSLCYVACEEF